MSFWTECLSLHIVPVSCWGCNANSTQPPSSRRDLVDLSPQTTHQAPPNSNTKHCNSVVFLSIYQCQALMRKRNAPQLKTFSRWFWCPSLNSSLIVCPPSHVLCEWMLRIDFFGFVFMLFKFCNFDIFFRFLVLFSHPVAWRAQNFLGGNILTLSEQQYFVWDTTSQCTKRQHMLEIWRQHWSPSPPG